MVYIVQILVFLFISKISRLPGRGWKGQESRWESVEQLTWEEEAEALAARYISIPGHGETKAVSPSSVAELVRLLLCMFSLSSSVSTVDLTVKFLDAKDRSKITCYNLK